MLIMNIAPFMFSVSSKSTVAAVVLSLSSVRYTLPFFADLCLPSIEHRSLTHVVLHFRSYKPFRCMLTDLFTNVQYITFSLCDI